MLYDIVSPQPLDGGTQDLGWKNAPEFQLAPPKVEYGHLLIVISFTH